MAENSVRSEFGGGLDKVLVIRMDGHHFWVELAVEECEGLFVLY